MEQMVLPSLSNDHLLNIMSDVGVVVDSSVGSSSSLLAIIRANEMAQAAIAKAKEAVASQVGASSSGSVVDAGTGSGQPQSNLSKRGTNKRANPAWPLAGRAFESRIFLINEGVILEY